MIRRSFLKGLFGLPVIAAVPKIAVADVHDVHPDIIEAHMNRMPLMDPRHSHGFIDEHGTGVLVFNGTHWDEYR